MQPPPPKRSSPRSARPARYGWSIGEPRDDRLGWTADDRVAAGSQPAGRVSRLDRGWSSVLVDLDVEPLRVRNLGADVAVGDFVVVSAGGERVHRVLPR